MLKQAFTEDNFMPKNTYSMDRKGFTLGMPNCAKVIYRAGRRHPRAKQDETREFITVIETICANTDAQFILSPMGIFQGAPHCRGWHTELKKKMAMQTPYSPIVHKATLLMSSGRHCLSTLTLGQGIKLLA